MTTTSHQPQNEGAIFRNWNEKGKHCIEVRSIRTFKPFEEQTKRTLALCSTLQVKAFRRDQSCFVGQHELVSPSAFGVIKRALVKLRFVGCPNWSLLAVQRQHRKPRHERGGYKGVMIELHEKKLGVKY